MSSRNWKFRIQDILKSIEKIENYTLDLTPIQFKKNELVQDAVIRNFEIIGEASNHIPKEVQEEHPFIPWNEMKGMRNILIHEYFGVDSSTVWYTIKKHLPLLKKQLQEIKKI